MTTPFLGEIKMVGSASHPALRAMQRSNPVHRSEHRPVLATRHDLRGQRPDHVCAARSPQPGPRPSGTGTGALELHPRPGERHRDGDAECQQIPAHNHTE